MTPFTKYWIECTCAPESIVIIRENTMAALIGIKDESSGNIQITVLEDLLANNIMAIGKTYEDICKSGSYSFRETSAVICEKLNLLSVPIP